MKKIFKAARFLSAPVVCLALSSPVFSQTLFNYTDGTPCTLFEITQDVLDVAEKGGICSNLPQVDSCLVGHWTLDYDSYDYELRRLLSTKPVDIQSADVSVEMLINNKGIMRSCIDGLVLMKAENRGVSAQIEIVMRGRSLAHIANETAEGMTNTICVNSISEQVINRTTVTVAGQLNEVDSASFFNAFPVGSKATCRGDILTVVTYPEGVDFVEHVFHRVR